QWVTIYRAPIYNLYIVRAKLDAFGIETNIPDAHIKVLDPWITGGGLALDADLQVPIQDQKRALSVLRKFPPGQGSGLIHTELDRIAQRIRWGSILWITAPIALYLAPRYLSMAKMSDEKPPYHWMTIFAIVWAWI